MAKFQELQEQASNSAEALPTLRATPGKIVTAQEITSNIGSDTFTIKDFLVQYYVYEDRLPPADWTIHGDSVANISGLECTKATATVREREWHVWFATDIPYPAGPWFLTGLPGLVVLAKDADDQVSYELSAFHGAHEKDVVLDENEAIAKYAMSYTKTTTLSKEGFFKLRDRAQKNPEGFRKAQSIAVIGVQDYGLLNSRSWTSSIPNPIDLEEIKK